MFDVDGFVGDCLTAVRDPEPRLAVKDLLDRTMAHRDEVAAGLPATDVALTTLHQSPELTVLNVVWPPGYVINPHEHQMFAAIGIYRGQEDNAFFRRTGPRIEPAGGRTLHEGDVAVLGHDVVHSVANPLSSSTGALHVYGGDLFAPARKNWGLETLEEIEGAFDPRSRTTGVPPAHDTGDRIRGDSWR